MLAIFILTRNEADLLALNLAYHLGTGFDHVLIADNESTDGTADVIRSFGDAVTSMRVARPNDRFEALSRLARQIEPRLDPDSWVAFSDTDEFWGAPQQPLRSLLDRIPTEVELLNSLAKHYVPTELDAQAGPVYERRVHCATDSSEPPYAGYTKGKSIYRAGRVLRYGVKDAHFCALVPKERMRRTSKPILHHYMIDGEDDFVQKVTSLDRWDMVLSPTTEVLAGNDRLSATKKVWWTIYRERGEAGLREYYRSNYLVSAAALPAMLASGKLARDDAFARFCAKRSRVPQPGA